MNQESGRVERFINKKRAKRRFAMTVSIALVAIILGASAYALYRTDRLDAVIADLDEYSASESPDAPLVADFVSCLKTDQGPFKVQPIECGGAMNEKHGPDSIHRIDTIIKTLARPS